MKAFLILAGLLSATALHAQPAAHFSVRLMTPEAAIKATQAAMAHCRKQGYQVAVAVVDRSGLVQALMRDRFAGAHTPEVAVDKAWTAASFRIPTTTLAKETQAGQPMSGIRQRARVMAIGGGLPIEAGGAVLGAIGVSGAPGGDADDACAKAGIQAIMDDLEL
ncbi:MAG: heme-binding protein [Burkholderiales bacterium]|uniref:GlcG/HbpS family heme-binding protein n=1 Tax=Inhella sp. TaxID=1921806 RepID=UPI001AC7FEF3|nr:heme-binding protein [Burkholderiales bacterium]